MRAFRSRAKEAEKEGVHLRSELEVDSHTRSVCRDKLERDIIWILPFLCYSICPIQSLYDMFGIYLDFSHKKPMTKRILYLIVHLQTCC